MKYLLGCVLLASVAATASAEPVVPIRLNGPSANRIGVTIVGDGYTQAQQLKYSTDVDLLVIGFFNQAPFAQYASYFNVYRVDVVSNESGADHPERGVFRDTALGSSYNCGNVARVICVDTVAVNAVLSRSVPIEARDLVLVLVNDTEYGGSGGSVVVASTHTDSVELALHEAGHTFGRLTDEYETSPPTCMNTFEPPEPNAALDIARDRIKWSRWIDAATALPTVDTTAGVAGAYQGARYCTTGLYRPTFNSKMRSLGRPFEQVNNEQLVRRVYNFVSPIDSALPAATSLAPASGSIVDFSVTTPQPTTGPLRMRWSVDGTFVGEANSLRLNTGAMAAGAHTVQVDVADDTSLVRTDPTGLLTQRRTWSVTVQQPSLDDMRRALEDLLRRWRSR